MIKKYIFKILSKRRNMREYNMSIKTNEQYNNLDLFKFTFAIVVVMIHTTPLKDISDNVNWYFSNTFCNMAVPFFFVTSGFLFFNKLQGLSETDEKSRLKKYVLHIIRMYLVWCVIWIPWKALNFYNSGHFNLSDAAGYIWNVIFVSGGDALWYLNALAFSIVLVYFLYKKVGCVPTLLIASIVYIIGVMISSWYNIFGNNHIGNLYYTLFNTTDNGLFTGFIYVSVGMVIAIKKCTNSLISWILSGMVFAALVAEAVLIRNCALNRDNVCNLFTMPIFVYFLFCGILSINCKGNNYLYLRNYSTLIYLVHTFIIRCLKLLLGVIKVNLPNTIMFLTVLILSLGFAVTIDYMARVKKFGWCRLLY